jgi:hypothetical protein
MLPIQVESPIEESQATTFQVWQTQARRSYLPEYKNEEIPLLGV